MRTTARGASPSHQRQHTSTPYRPTNRRSVIAPRLRDAVHAGMSLMALRRMDHLSVVVDDLAVAIAFFVELGMEVEGQTFVEGRAAERLNQLDNLRVEIAMMRMPDGQSKLELSKF